jgi:hypothetical protein
LHAEVLWALATGTGDTESSAGKSRWWIAGWVDGIAPLIVPSTQPRVDRSVTLVTCPLSIRPSRSGENVLIDAGFNTIVIAPGAAPIYDPWARTWLASNQPGSWEIGFRPPAQIGRLRLTGATLKANVALPVHAMTILRNQVRNGKRLTNANGAVVAEWSYTFGSQPIIHLDLSSRDVDADGVLWLLVNVKLSQGGAAATHAWQIADLGVDLEGRVEP